MYESIALFDRVAATMPVEEQAVRAATPQPVPLTREVR